MHTKVIATKTRHVLNYREIGEAPNLRTVRRKAIENKDTNRLNVACEYLAHLMMDPMKVQRAEQYYYGR